MSFSQISSVSNRKKSLAKRAALCWPSPVLPKGLIQASLLFFTVAKFIVCVHLTYLGSLLLMDTCSIFNLL